MSYDGVRLRGRGETVLSVLSLRPVAIYFEVLAPVLLFHDIVLKGQGLTDGRQRVLG